MKSFIAVSLLIASIAGAQPAAPASQAPPAAAAAPAASRPVVDTKSEAVLRKLAENIKAAKTASAEIVTAVKFEAGGRKEDMTANATLSVERPNKLALVVKEPKSGGGSAVSDGQKLNMHVAQLKKYSEQDAPATLDEIIESPVIALAQQGGVVLVLFHSDGYNKLLDNVSKATYIAEEEIDGVKCDHIKLQRADFDFDVWITSGEKPTLRRLKPDLQRQVAMAAAQNPEMKDAKFDASVDINNWKLDPALPADAFAFAAPKDTEKVESMEELFGGGGDQAATKLKGKPAPEFSLDKLSGGQVKLADHKGKDVVILDFWATWCGPCVQGLPIVSEVAKGFADKGVVLYAVNQEEDAATIEPFLKEKKLDLKVLLDKDGKVGGLFGVQGIPQTVIIGKDGLVKVVHVGFSPSLKSQLTRELEKILGEAK